MCCDTDKFHKIFIVLTVSLTLMQFISDYFAVIPDVAILSGKCPYTFESLLAEVGRSKEAMAVNPISVVQAPTVVIETAIVCSKQFADNFGHDRDKVLDFFSAYFWDISMHFQTLPSSKISFSITSLTLISSREEQPFIEDLRDPKFGNASLEKILPHFISWITPEAAEHPGFDMVMLVTEPEIDNFADAAALFGGMCGSVSDDTGVRLTGVMVLDGTLKAGPQTIAYLLGAPFDDKNPMRKDAKNSNMKRGTVAEISHFFSFSTDKYIRKFLASNNSKCLKSNSALVPLVDPDFDTVLPPTILEQCRLLSGNGTAFTIPRNDGEECGLTECVRNHSSIFIAPLTYSKCGNEGHRCFRGRCIPPGLLLSNVGTGKFLLPIETVLNNETEMTINICPRTSSPSERFQPVVLYFTETAVVNLLIVPCTKMDGHVTVTEYPCIDKCLAATRPYGGRPRLENCNVTDDLQKWVFLDHRVEENDFLLFNVKTNSCLRPVYNNNVNGFDFHYRSGPETPFLHPKCNPTDPDLRWKFLPVLAVPELCPNKDDCKPRLEAIAFARFFSSSNLSVTVILKNMEGVAMAPAAIISWKSNITLITKPGNCVFLQSGLKCKVAMLLKKGQAYVIADLEFDASGVALHTNKRNLTEQLNLTVTTATSKTMYTGLITPMSNPTSSSITSIREKILGLHLNILFGIHWLLFYTPFIFLAVIICSGLRCVIEFMIRPRIYFRGRRWVKRRHGEGKF